MPINIPTGDEKAKQNTNSLINVGSFGKVFTKLIPSDMPAIPLCTRIATKMLIVSPKFLQRPSASPSKNEWTDKATMMI